MSSATVERRGPVRHKGGGPGVAGWVDPRSRGVGGRAFALHRLTGLALVVYLYLHLGVLSMLLIGPSSWDGFLGVVTARGFLALDVLILFALLFHGLNGVRVALVGSGIAVRGQRALFWIAATVGTAALVAGAVHVFGGM